MMFAEFLRGEGYELEEAGDMMAARRSIFNAKNQGKPFDLIITDYQLSEADKQDNGEGVVWTAKENCIPVIMMSANPDVEKITRANKFLSKPVYLEELLLAVKELLP